MNTILITIRCLKCGLETKSDNVDDQLDPEMFLKCGNEKCRDDSRRLNNIDDIDHTLSLNVAVDVLSRRKVIGSLVFTIERDLELETTMDNLFVEPGFRRQGLATRLLKMFGCFLQKIDTNLIYSVVPYGADDADGMNYHQLCKLYNKYLGGF